MNTASRMTSPTRSRFLISGIIILKTTAISKPDRRAGHAGQDPPQRVDLAVARVQRRQDRGDHHRRADQPGKGRDAAGDAAKARAEHDRQIDDVRPWQKMAQREGLVEFLRRHPAVLVDDAAPGPDQHPAEAGQRHFGERHEQLEQAGLDWRGCGGEIRRRNGGRRGFRRAMTQNLERRRRQGQPNSACSRAASRPYARHYFSRHLRPILGVPVRRLWK